MTEKKYGLVIPTKSNNNSRLEFKNQLKVAQKNLFSQYEEEDEKPQTLAKKVDLNTLKHVEKALEEDANVFDYDATYDDTKSRTVKNKDDGRPRYMQDLLNAAQERKVEQLRVQERRIQKERAEDEEKFQGLEKFVTNAYKEHLEEIRKLEKEEKDEPRDIQGFYRGMLDQVVRKERGEEEIVEKRQEEQSDEEPRYGLQVPKSRRNDVDKRETLSAGLNVVKKPVQRDPVGYSPGLQHGKRNDRSSETKRLVMEVERQREERDRMEKEKMEQRRLELMKKLARRNDEAAIEAARQRYFERLAVKRAVSAE